MPVIEVGRWDLDEMFDSDEFLESLARRVRLLPREMESTTSVDRIPEGFEISLEYQRIPPIEEGEEVEVVGELLFDTICDYLQRREHQRKEIG